MQLEMEKIFETATVSNSTKTSPDLAPLYNNNLPYESHFRFSLQSGKTIERERGKTKRKRER